MKWQNIVFVVILAYVTAAQAQGKTLAATMEVYVFPKSGQNTTQQSQDEAACYEWATQNVGSDPFELSKQAAQQQAATEQAKANTKQGVAGTGVRGALRGAAAGAVIGEIADDDAGKGAAYGAAAGAVVNRRRARRAQQEESQRIEQQGQATQQSTQHQVENFKKAFGVCLEAKEYLVKY